MVAVLLKNSHGQMNFTQNLMLQKIQEMEERRIVRLGESMKTYAEVDRQVIPIIGKCLDGIVKAAECIDEKTVSMGGDLVQPSRDRPLLSVSTVAASALSGCSMF